MQEQRRDDHRFQRGPTDGGGRPFDRPVDRPSSNPVQTRPPASNQNRPPMPRRDEGFRRKENLSSQPKPQTSPPVKQQEVSLSALSSAPVDFKGHKIQDKPRSNHNNRDKKEVDTGELKKLLEESLKKKE